MDRMQLPAEPEGRTAQGIESLPGFHDRGPQRHLPLTRKAGSVRPFSLANCECRMAFSQRAKPIARPGESPSSAGAVHVPGKRAAGFAQYSGW